MLFQMSKTTKTTLWEHIAAYLYEYEQNGKLPMTFADLKLQHTHHLTYPAAFCFSVSNQSLCVISRLQTASPPAVCQWGWQLAGYSKHRLWDPCLQPSQVKGELKFRFFFCPCYFLIGKVVTGAKATTVNSCCLCTFAASLYSSSVQLLSHCHSHPPNNQQPCHGACWPAGKHCVRFCPTVIL